MEATSRLSEYIRAFMTEINPSSVRCLGSAALSKSIDLNRFSTGYAKHQVLGDLADGIYWVNVSGTGTDSVGGEWFGWTFTLDTSNRDHNV